MIWPMFRRYPRNRSGNLAKKRLQILLVTDKVDCSQELIERIKDDMIDVISKYITVNCEDIELRVINKAPGISLYAVFPILQVPNKGIC